MSTMTQAEQIADANASVKRIYNFSAGPACLPPSVIEQAQQDVWSLDDTGIGIMEHSHRGKAFERVLEETDRDCRAVGGISDDYEVLFLQGGASTQFALIPMNFLKPDATADYADTGTWANKAYKEAKRFGDVNLAFDGSVCDYDHTPGKDELKTTAGAAYFHYCSNNTICGTRHDETPAVDAPLIVDTSSEMYSRPMEFDRHALIYAGAQKNLGPSGVTLVIVRKDFLAEANADLPTMFAYQNHAAKGSRLNTPPTFGIYIMGLVFKWIQQRGGLDAIEQHNTAKAKIIYDAIDSSSGFYTPVARNDCRSVMNITFRSPNADLDSAFVTEALANDMSGLKGHRSVGGLRASVYNAFPLDGCTALAQFMAEFARTNG